MKIYMKFEITFNVNKKLWKNEDNKIPCQFILETNKKQEEFNRENSIFIIEYDKNILQNKIYIRYGKNAYTYDDLEKIEKYDGFERNTFAKLLLLKICGRSIVVLPENKYEIIFENDIKNNPNFICIIPFYGCSQSKKIILKTDKYMQEEQLEYIYFNQPFIKCIEIMRENYHYIIYFLSIDFIKTFEAFENGEFNHFIEKKEDIDYTWIFRKLKRFNMIYNYSIISLFLKNSVSIEKINKLLKIDLVNCLYGKINYFNHFKIDDNIRKIYEDKF
jgi:hypothetical protein